MVHNRLKLGSQPPFIVKLVERWAGARYGTKPEREGRSDVSCWPSHVLSARALCRYLMAKVGYEPGSRNPSRYGAGSILSGKLRIYSSQCSLEHGAYA